MDKIRNPMTGRMIKLGGKMHKTLISEGTMQDYKINIKNLDDNYERYKISPVKLNYYNNSVHFSNILEICKELNVNHILLVHFMKQTFHKMKIVYFDDCCTIILDKCEGKFIQNCVEEFIEKHVLCKKCNNPETKRIVSIVCNACGYQHN